MSKSSKNPIFIGFFEQQTKNKKTAKKKKQ